MPKSNKPSVQASAPAPSPAVPVAPAAPAPPRQAFTVTQFAKEHGISRTRYYMLKREGLGPRTFRVGVRELISQEAAAEWRRMMEQRSSEQAS